MRRSSAGRALGLIVALIAASGAAAGAPEAAAAKNPAGPAPEAARARQVFERFQALAGEWRGRSSKGWTSRASFRIIASGSTVVETTDFAAHPNDTMMTMYHLDGGTMMLTHYCVARNQPRLRVTSVENGGRKVRFSFRDATNLASRDQGHMDRAEFEFQDRDHFSSRWSFHKDGREDWMEEIHYERVR